MISQQVSGNNVYSQLTFLADRRCRYQRKYGIRNFKPGWYSCQEVLYYSNDILSRALSDEGPYVSLGITLVNVLMTFPPIFLVDVSNEYSLFTD
jgi:hypothetical protein